MALVAYTAIGLKYTTSTKETTIMKDKALAIELRWIKEPAGPFYFSLCGQYTIQPAYVSGGRIHKYMLRYKSQTANGAARVKVWDTATVIEAKQMATRWAASFVKEYQPMWAAYFVDDDGDA